MNRNNILLEIKNVSKKFPGVMALKEISFNVKKGEIHAIVGENGAGKSTLIKIVSGVYSPDGGELVFNSKKIEKYSVVNSKKLGISTIYQEINLISDLTVAENLYFDDFPKNKFGIINYHL